MSPLCDLVAKKPDCRSLVVYRLGAAEELSLDNPKEEFAMTFAVDVGIGYHLSGIELLSSATASGAFVTVAAHRPSPRRPSLC
jgi:hypothetical protein